jgi:hypothetical protein
MPMFRPTSSGPSATASEQAIETTCRCWPGASFVSYRAVSSTAACPFPLAFVKRLFHCAQDDDGRGRAWVHVPQGSLSQPCRPAAGSDHRSCRIRTGFGGLQYAVPAEPQGRVFGSDTTRHGCRTCGCFWYGSASSARCGNLADMCWKGSIMGGDSDPAIPDAELTRRSRRLGKATSRQPPPSWSGRALARHGASCFRPRFRAPRAVSSSRRG